MAEVQQASSGSRYQDRPALQDGPLHDPLPLRTGSGSVSKLQADAQVRPQAGRPGRRTTSSLAIGGITARDGLADRLCWGAVPVERLPNGPRRLRRRLLLGRAGPADWRSGSQRAGYVDTVNQAHRGVLAYPLPVPREFHRDVRVGPAGRATHRQNAGTREASWVLSRPPLSSSTTSRVLTCVRATRGLLTTSTASSALRAARADARSSAAARYARADGTGPSRPRQRGLDSLACNWPRRSPRRSPRTARACSAGRVFLRYGDWPHLREVLGPPPPRPCGDGKRRLRSSAHRRYLHSEGPQAPVRSWDDAQIFSNGA